MFVKWSSMPTHVYRYRVFTLSLDNLINLEIVYNGVKGGVFARTKLKIVHPSQPVTSCTIQVGGCDLSICLACSAEQLLTQLGLTVPSQLFLKYEQVLLSMVDTFSCNIFNRQHAFVRKIPIQFYFSWLRLQLHMLLSIVLLQNVQGDQFVFYVTLNLRAEEQFSLTHIFEYK